MDHTVNMPCNHLTDTFTVISSHKRCEQLIGGNRQQNMWTWIGIKTSVVVAIKSEELKIIPKIAPAGAWNVRVLNISFYSDAPSHDKLEYRSTLAYCVLANNPICVQFVE